MNLFRKLTRQSVHKWGLKRLARFLFLSSFFMILTGCGLFGDGKDHSVLGKKNPRKAKFACSKMNLQDSNLDPETVVAIVECLNNGSLNATEKWLKSIPPEKLEVLLKETNSRIMNNPVLLYEIARTFDAMKKQGIVQDAFKRVGQVLQNGEFITSTFGLLKEGYYEKSLLSGKKADKNLLQAISLIAKGLNFDNLNNGLEVGINIAGARSFKDLQTDLKTNPAPSKGISLDQLVQNGYDYFHQKHTYRCDDLNPEVPIKDDFIAAVRSGSLFPVLDEVIGVTATEVQKRVPNVAKLLEEVVQVSSDQPPAKRIELLSAALHDLNGPIQCLKGTQSIPNASRHLMSELSYLDSSKPGPVEKYLLRESRLTLMAAGAACDLPKNLSEHYQIVDELTLAGAMTPFAQLYQAADRPVIPWPGCDGKGKGPENYHPLTSFLLNFLSDSSFKFLVPSLTELSRKNVNADLLLILGLPADRDRVMFQEALQYLVKPFPELDDQTIADVFLNVVSRNSLLQLYRFVSSFQKFLEIDEPFLESAFQNMHKAGQVNKVRPFSGLLLGMAADAPKLSKFMEVIFDIMDSPHAGPAIVEISGILQKPDGVQLAEDIISLNRKFAEAGKKPIPEFTAKKYTPTRRHDWRRSELNKSEIGPVKLTDLNISVDCTKLNLNLSLGQLKNSAEQLAYILNCLGQSELENLFVVPPGQYTTQQEKEDKEKELKKFAFEFSEKALGLFGNASKNFTPTDLKALIGLWQRSMATDANGTVPFFRMLDATALFIKAPQGLAEPFLDILSVILTKSSGEFQDLRYYGAGLVKNQEFPKLLSDFSELIDKMKDPAPVARSPIDDVLDRLRPQVAQLLAKEDPALLRNGAEARIQEILDGAKNNVNTWELVNGQPRTNWTHDDAKKWLDPILDKLSDFSKSDPQHLLVDTLLEFLKYFSLAEGETPRPDAFLTSDDLLDWLYDRSIDYKPILFYYPGEKTPRIQLMNRLDLYAGVLDATNTSLRDLSSFAQALNKIPALILGDALPLKKNLGLDFLAEVGDAFGDLPSENLIPQEVKNRATTPSHFANGAWLDGQIKVPTAREAVGDITNRRKRLENLTWLSQALGYPDGTYPPGGDLWTGTLKLALDKVRLLPDLEDFRRKLFNIQQMNSVLVDEAPPGTYSPKRPYPGLFFLTLLFHKIDISTPSELRTSQAHSVSTKWDENNLLTVLNSAKLGAFRNIARVLQNFKRPDSNNPDDPNRADWENLRKAFKLIVHLATLPEFKPLLVTVLDSGILREQLRAPPGAPFYSYPAYGPQTPRADSSHEMMNQIIKSIFKEVDQAVVENRIAQVKQLGFYSLVSLEKLDPYQPGQPDRGLLSLILRQGRRSVAQFKDFIKAPNDLIPDLFRIQIVPSVVQAFAEDADPDRSFRIGRLAWDFLKEESLSNPDPGRLGKVVSILQNIYTDQKSAPAWKEVQNRIRTLTATQEYKQLRLKQAMQPVIDLMAHKNLSSQEERDLSDRLRLTFSDVLVSPNFDDLLGFLVSNPDQINKLLQVLAHYSGGDRQSGLKYLSEVLKRTLSEPAH